MNIYVGNLSPKTSDQQLRKAFEMYGKVDKVSLDSKPRNDDAYGFCFVEMPFENQASRAIKQLHGKMMGGASLTVKESGVSI
ncbi:MAG: RNA-binding protein [candidate division Zixibacteria bacterium]|nr:RNA-binding protein [candidate division Zixibacteria bacterium]MDH3936044.1 RNA-binding protein [candidate division Zixibacteria bacterium]MDH4035223.1 RNA-binding protein [candidate division Zixibacteria bacterium]